MRKKRASEEIVRKEINLMIQCFTEELFLTFSKKEIKAIYLLGSANKPWNSVIDYIPGFSDVDLNIYVKNPDNFKRYFSDMKKAVDFSHNYEKKYLKNNLKPFHIPRLQAQLYNVFLDEPDYLTPASSVKTLYGVPYADTLPKHNKKTIDRKKTILEQEKYTSDITLRVMSANEDRIIRYLKEIYYRVCSTVPMILLLFEEDSEKILNLNKTNTAKMIKLRGFNNLSKNYSTMLKYINEYYLTKDINTARKSIIIGHAVLLECIKIAKQ